ncbi:class II aldolase/adducin family protein [uncultured Rhodoblastus sp.]|uniref:class II aldolase/adducin family protein n=1 Tax=uncultured Rhodoblastus sp. TaxID=543037 RepID=UPI0025DC5155|nr:class II aldolase/adducin family protein [uncultured Rhodoblastus sp.]
MARPIKKQAPGRKKQAQARKNLVEAARAMNALGINQGAAGNISLRIDNAMLITPSG